MGEQENELLEAMDKESTAGGCACGSKYSETAWEELEIVGYQSVDDQEALELRQCLCGSTIARSLHQCGDCGNKAPYIYTSKLRGPLCVNCLPDVASLTLDGFGDSCVECGDPAPYVRGEHDRTEWYCPNHAGVSGVC